MSLTNLFDLGPYYLQVLIQSGTPAYTNQFSKGQSHSFTVSGTTYSIAVDNSGVVTLAYVSGTTPVANTGQLPFTVVVMNDADGATNLPGHIYIDNIVVAFSYTYATGDNVPTTYLTVAADGTCTPNPFDAGTSTTTAIVAAGYNGGLYYPHTSAFPTIVSYSPVTDYSSAFWQDFAGCREI